MTKAEKISYCVSNVETTAAVIDKEIRAGFFDEIAVGILIQDIRSQLNEASRLLKTGEHNGAV